MMTTEIQIQKASSVSSEKIISFLNQELRSQSEFSIEAEYPAMFSEFPGGDSLIITQGEEIVSHAAYVIREFQSANYRMKMGVVGSVATRKDFRGQGYASRLMKKAFDEMRSRGCMVSLLWSDNEQFYYPLGFYRIGRELDLKFSMESVPDMLDGVREATSQDVAHIWRLYQRHELKIDRSLEEQKLLLKTPLAKVYVWADSSGVKSYVVINKGVDFKNYIHEWGGDIQGVTQIVAYCQRKIYKQTPLTLISPAAIDLNPLKQFAVEKWEGVVGLMKVLDRTLLMSLYENFLKRQNIAYSWNREKNGLFFGKDEHFIRNDQELLKLVFGEGGTPKNHPELPFFLWGFDSI